MRKFYTSGFYTGIVILVFAAAFENLDKYIPLAIWTAGMAVGLLSSKPNA